MYSKAFSLLKEDQESSDVTYGSLLCLLDSVIELVPFLFPRSLLSLMTICHVSESAHKDHEDE
jgi:hypothetical protein